MWKGSRRKLHPLPFLHEVDPSKMQQAKEEPIVSTQHIQVSSLRRKCDWNSITPQPGEDLECVDRFHYLGDVIDRSGRIGAAVTSRIRCSWMKFKELAAF